MSVSVCVSVYLFMYAYCMHSAITRSLKEWCCCLLTADSRWWRRARKICGEWQEREGIFLPAGRTQRQRPQHLHQQRLRHQAVKRWPEHVRQWHWLNRQIQKLPGQKNATAAIWITVHWFIIKANPWLPELFGDFYTVLYVNKNLFLYLWNRGEVTTLNVHFTSDVYEWTVNFCL